MRSARECTAKLLLIIWAVPLQVLQTIWAVDRANSGNWVVFMAWSNRRRVTFYNRSNTLLIQRFPTYLYGHSASSTVHHSSNNREAAVHGRRFQIKWHQPFWVVAFWPRRFWENRWFFHLLFRCLVFMWSWFAKSVHFKWRRVEKCRSSGMSNLKVLFWYCMRVFAIKY